MQRDNHGAKTFAADPPVLTMTLAELYVLFDAHNDAAFGGRLHVMLKYISQGRD